MQGPLRESLHALLEQEGGDALLPLLGAGEREHDENFAHRALGDEHLRAIEDPGASLADRGGAQRGGVGSAARLGQTPGRELLSGSDVGNVLLAQFLAAEAEQVGSAEAVVRGDGERQGAVEAGDLLDHHGDRDGVEGRSSQLLGHRHSQQAQLSQLRDDLARESLFAVPLLRVRLDLPQAEVADHRDELSLAFGRLEVHQETRLQCSGRSASARRGQSPLLRCRGGKTGFYTRGASRCEGIARTSPQSAAPPIKAQRMATFGRNSSR